MEASIKTAWLLLALLHVMPALSTFAPDLSQRLYGVSPDGDLGILLVHRGALFLAVFVTALYALFDPASRRLASIVLTISMLGYLVVYANGGMPAGALQRVAIADIIWLIPLGWAGYHAWQ